MKQYPRIYSLSTLGLIHHQEFDYLFHPFRTDFIGESGSGKSMIADLIQLIFVGSDAFESATKATGKREPEGMVLSEGGHGKTMGYAFLNIEMEPRKYFVVGSYIETGNKNVQAFVVQQGFEKDNIVYLDNPISHKDFTLNEEIQPLDKLKDILIEKGLFCQSWSRLKKYHELLYKQNIVPINITANDRQMRDYAEILQSFSRGKLLDTQKSSSLKDFLFGKDAANKIHEGYKAAVKDMEASIGEYGSNLKEISRVTEKQAAILELKANRDERDYYQKDWIEKHLLYTNQETGKFHREIIDTITEFITAKQHYLILHELLGAEIILLESILPGLELEKKSASNKYEDSFVSYKEVERVQYWLKECSCTFEKLKEKYVENSQMRSKRTSLTNFIQVLKSQNLETVFDNIEMKDTIDSINQFLSDEITNLKIQIETKEMLRRFSNLTDPDSFAYWAIQQNRAFSLEEESVILEFQKLPRQKPANKSGDYLPSPDEFMNALQIIEKEGTGFWVNLKGVRRFVAYTPKQVFNTTDTQSIASYFSSYSDSLEQEIVKCKKAITDYSAIQKLLLNLSNPTESLSAYNNKEKITSYKLVNSLNVGEVEFDKALEAYENKFEIEQIYTEARQNLDDVQTKITEGKTMLNVYKSFQEAAPKVREGFIDLLSGADEFANIAEEINGNYGFIKNNVQLTFSQSKDKIAFIKKSQDEIQPKLSGILGLQAKIRVYQEWKEKFANAKQQYLQLYNTLPDNLTSKGYISNPEKEHNRYLVAETTYVKSYKDALQKYIPTEAYRLEEEDNLSELAKNLLPEAFHDAILSDQSEKTIIETIANYLHRINDKNRQLNNRKIQKIKDLLHEVDLAISDQENTIRRIDNFLKNETSITGGYKARLKKTTSTLFPKEWMSRFQENLEDSTNNFTAKLAEKIDLENMIITAFLDCGGYHSAQVTTQKLLDPSVYYEVEFNMESETGRINKGSTGQTYAAIALLCIARLSVMDKEEGKKQQPAIRVMPIDEAEGLGSNYDMLHNIAKAYDYQIISLSIGPVGKFKDGEQYLYMLHKNMESDAAVNYTPIAILSEVDKSKIGNDIEI
ncbi:synaptonemal complex protein 1 [Chitinophaga silvisoli]|uniref:MukB N-terminal domain-containing protein n=1 Tax=Chitinophaga silvisoli TaxID=2291814 RepID=A0A3E1P4D2_9BACT|nr:hypothetical protein [Chitinophaga silvisoli]RFM35035.1 hypothetical protein DXN04_06440 [Chitinophaga silvisoli]